jgi:hypothetical protein
MKSFELLFFNNQIGLFTYFAIRSSFITTILMNLNIVKRVCSTAKFAWSDSIFAIIKMKIINVFIETVNDLLKWHQFLTILILTFYKTCIVEIFYIWILWHAFEIVIQANSINVKTKFIEILILKFVTLYIIFNQINLRIWTLKLKWFHMNHA